MQHLTDFYTARNEHARLLTRHGQVEYLTTMRYIDRYLTAGARVLEIGAGTGRYSHALAQQGYSVAAVELLQHNIDFFIAHTQPGEQVTVHQGDARDLSAFGDDTYDITLILGPLYHLYTMQGKCQVIREALRVTRPGGVIFAAYCISDGAILNAGFVRNRFDLAEYIERGLIDPVTFQATSSPTEVFDVVRREYINELMAAFPVQRLHYLATDLLAEHLREVLAEMDEETFALYLRYHFAICERPDMVGFTNHTLDIFRKQAPT